MSFEVIFWFVIFPIVTIGIITSKVINYRRVNRRRLEEARERNAAYHSELDRVKALPALDTSWLMPAPFDKFPPVGDETVRRTYGTRYNRIYIIDESGYQWLGLVTPQIIEGLKAGEYIVKNYFIPFKGAGERDSGPSVTVALPNVTMTIDIYPIWMKKDVNVSDWEMWARIELNFSTIKDWSYQHALIGLWKYMDEFRENRARLENLRRQANVE